MCDQCVHRTKLYASPAALVAKIGCGNVVVSIGLYEGEGTETLDDCRGCLWAGESLQEFLQDEARRDHHVRTGERLNQGLYFGRISDRVASKSE